MAVWTPVEGERDLDTCTVLASCGHHVSVYYDRRMYPPRTHGLSVFIDPRETETRTVCVVNASRERCPACETDNGEASHKTTLERARLLG